MTVLDEARGAAYDQADFAPVALQVVDPTAVAVATDSDIETPEDLVAAAEEAPGKLRATTTGVASNEHFALAQLEEVTGADIAPVHFADGSTAATTAFLGGNTEVLLTNVSDLQPLADSGKVRIVGVMDAERAESLPDVPTFKESGYDVEISSSRGYSFPAGTPDEVRADPRVYEVLGLYRAHEIADRWSQSERPPIASEMRELHKTILGDTRGAGEYKQFSNAIAGATHKTTEPYDVARVILEIADWWAEGTPDPILTATVVHAWFAHVHPFDDGNGRTARVLANLELARHGYPPLIIRPESDRGQYYTALAQSDDGDLLPLYDLFVNAIRRQVKLMSRPAYVLELIEDKFLASEKDRLTFWRTTLDTLQAELEEECRRKGATFKLYGKPSLQSFSLLRERNRDGNSWFAEIGRPGRPAMWLLWFGYQSDDYCDITPDEKRFPSIFVSIRDYDASAVHPYTTEFDHSMIEPGVPEEIVVMPGVGHPVRFRSGFDISTYKAAPAGRQLADQLFLWL
jgi:hypothetical protein